MRNESALEINKELEGSVESGVLVMGLGNFLMGDEGIGVHLAQEMEKMELPEFIKVVDGGTGGFFLMGYFDQFDKVILVDATMDGKCSFVAI